MYIYFLIWLKASISECLSRNFVLEHLLIVIVHVRLPANEWRRDRQGKCVSHVTCCHRVVTLPLSPLGQSAILATGRVSMSLLSRRKRKIWPFSYKLHFCWIMYLDINQSFIGRNMLIYAICNVWNMVSLQHSLGTKRDVCAVGRRPFARVRVRCACVLHAVRETRTTVQSTGRPLLYTWPSHKPFDQRPATWASSSTRRRTRLPCSPPTRSSPSSRGSPSLWASR